MSVVVTWVVVAEQQRATIYGVHKGMARLRRIETLDAAGAGFGDGPEDGFVAELGRHLETAWLDGRLDALVLVGTPACLAGLRARLSDPLLAALIGEIDGSRLSADRDALQREVLRVL